MWESIIVVVVALTAWVLLRKAWRWWLRRSALSRIDVDAIIRLERNVTIRALLYGMPPVMGLNPKRTNHLNGDLVLTADRFLLASDRGVLADVGDGHGRPFSSVRCTGPGRLVMEGDIPKPDGEKGLFRYELVVEDAPAWAEALSPFVRDDDEARRYARRPPGM